MPRIETRITSVQIVPGFVTCLTILNPPGWGAPPQQPSVTNVQPDAGVEYICCTSVAQCPNHPPQPRSPLQVGDFAKDIDPSSSTTCSLENYLVHPPGVPVQQVCETGIRTLPTSEVEDTSMVGDQYHIPTADANRSGLPLTSILESTSSGSRDPDRFYQRKLNHESITVNYAVGRGGWKDEPPTSLDFSSCKDGPIFYVNEVVDKKVDQIWKWDAGCNHWVSVREGEMFRTGRDRILELDGNRIPRLRAVRKRGRAGET